MTDITKERLLEKAWRFDIQHGPDGEANYAWVYNGKDLVATMRTHYAASVVEAMNRRTLPPVDGLEVVAELNRIIAEEAADFADAAGHAIEAGERPDLWDREVEVSVHTLSQASSVIAGLKEANEALMRERTNMIETKREQIERLTKEMDAAIIQVSEQARRRGEAEGALHASELAGVVEGWMARAEAAEARVKELEEALAFYGDVSKYPAPLTGGMGELWSDCGQTARTALKGGSNG